ncbi:hypothetical protein [Mucilaginibacter sp. OK283]|uniref:hypothetical protein n=1 Tax=Mucilaginibacter sp. OK283 TaxID=1881049 RepID=UPI0008AAFC34|nr:hypothetical protein [Mucilaginibacter sp. OK283]SEP40331.1 hypothetical protein SAMN05428947_114130 [Mucilaginibacter sp. OK283]
MIRKSLTTALFTLAVIATCFGADITGKWTGKVMNQFDVTYIFKVDGEKLTGTTTGPDGTSVTLQNGVIKDDDLSFTMDLMGNTTKVTGKVKDNVITLTLPGMNGGDAITLVLKKEK